MFNIYGQWVPDGALYHHGVKGMRWGERNGPPYPLAPGDHSASEKKAGWRKSLNGCSSDSDKVNRIYEKRSRKTGILRRVKPLSKKEKETIYSHYINKMTAEEVEEIARLTKKHKDDFDKLAPEWLKYEKEFMSDPKRKKIYDDFEGAADGRALYRAMFEALPNKTVERLSNAEYESYKKAETYITNIRDRIMNDEKHGIDLSVRTRIYDGNRHAYPQTPHELATRAITDMDAVNRLHSVYEKRQRAKTDAHNRKN